MRAPGIDELELQQADLEREWGNIQTNVERSAALDQNIATLEAGLQDVRARLMDVDQVALNYEFFYDLERTTGVTFKQFSQGVASDGAGLPTGREKFSHFSVIPYDIVMTGTLQQILSFMDTLDRQRFIVRMDFLNVAPPAESEGASGELNARMRCHVLASVK